MTTVNVDVNGRAFKIACNDGEEAQVRALAGAVDAKMREVVSMVGQIGEERLLLMAAMLLADDVTELAKKKTEAEKALGDLRAANAQLEAQQSSVEGRAADQLEAAAGRVEAVLEIFEKK